MIKKYSVYYHRTPKGKYYIGVAKNPKKRWGKDGYGYKKQQKFYRAIKKYGWANIEHKIIVSDLTLDEAYQLEKQLIEQYNAFKNGYNSDLGGAGAEGHTVSAESRKYMSKLKQGKKLSAEQIQRLKETKNFPVYVYSIEGQLLVTYKNARIASTALAIPRSSIINCCNCQHVYNGQYIFVNDKSKHKISKLVKAYAKKLQLKNLDTVFQYDLDGNLLASYKSITQASQLTNIPIGAIGQSCSNFRLYISDSFFLHSTNQAEIKTRVKNIKISRSSRKPNTNKYYNVGQYTLDNKLIAVYKNYKEAAQNTGCSRASIKGNCNNQSKTVQRKFIFKKIMLDKIETEKTREE